jgi:hypothetical protein
MRAVFDASLLEGKIPNLPADSIHWVYHFLPGYIESFANDIDSGDPRTTSSHLDSVSSELTITITEHDKV